MNKTYTLEFLSCVIMLYLIKQNALFARHLEYAFKDTGKSGRVSLMYILSY